MNESNNCCFACSWAVSTVMTRQNFVPSSDGKTMLNALIPMWDMCNHSNGKVSIQIFSIYSEFLVIRLLLMLYRRLVHCNNNLVCRVYMMLPKNSGNLNRAPEPVVVCPSAARCG